jgi:hypothetical protein
MITSGNAHRPRASTPEPSTGRIMPAEEHTAYIETTKGWLAGMSPEARAIFVKANRGQPWAVGWVDEVDRESAVKSAGDTAAAARLEHDAYIAKAAAARGVTPREAERALYARNDDPEFRAILGRWHEASYAKALGQAGESVAQKELRTHVEAIAKSRGVTVERDVGRAHERHEGQRPLRRGRERQRSRAGWCPVNAANTRAVRPGRPGTPVPPRAAATATSEPRHRAGRAEVAGESRNQLPRVTMGTCVRSPRRSTSRVSPRSPCRGARAAAACRSACSGTRGLAPTACCSR